MEKITFNKNHRPKSTRIYQRALTESNNCSNKYNRKNYYFPNIKDKMIKNSYNKSRIKFRNFPHYCYNTFFMTSTPFNYVKNKKKDNEFCICYNGGPKKKFSLCSKKLHLDMPKINSFSNLKKFRIKTEVCPTTSAANNQKEKIKYNYLYDHLEEEKNNNEKIKVDKILYTERDKKENYEEKKTINNYFKKNKKVKFNFRKIQIHNNCKPFLVDDYRYYAEKYL